MNTAADKGGMQKELQQLHQNGDHFSFRLFSTATKEYSSSGADNLGN